MTEITAHHGIFKDTNLHVDDTGGSGRPIVLIHGWPMTSESWAPQVPVFAQAGYRVITYDRRGFGRSDKPVRGYTYDTLAEDLHTLIEEMDLNDVTLVGFSMAGGEVVRYNSSYGPDRLRSVVLASAVTPYMMQTDDNPNGPLTVDAATEMSAGLAADEDAFYEEFTRAFYSANGELMVSEQQRRQAITMCKQADKKAALACMAAFGSTDFREDLLKLSLPTLVIHGDSDATVPYEGSGRLTHEAVSGSEMHLLRNGPHGCTLSHAEEWNEAVLRFLER